MEDDYIPLPTVSRKYIDLPDTIIVNTMPKKTRRKKDLPEESDTPPTKINTSNIIHTNRHSLGNDQIDCLLIDIRRRRTTNKNSKRPIPPPINTAPPQSLITRHKSISL